MRDTGAAVILLLVLIAVLMGGLGIAGEFYFPGLHDFSRPLP